MMSSRASFTQPGHSESVCRGQPSVGLLFSHDFSSGLSDHFGVKFGLGLCWLKICIVSNANPAVLAATKSIVFSIFEVIPPAFLGIFMPHFHKRKLGLSP